MAEQQVLYLSRADVETVDLPMQEIIELLETAFREKGNGKVEMPPKPGIHTMPDAFIHAMPAYIPALHSVGAKWVSGYPENYRRGLLNISSLLILNDLYPLSSLVTEAIINQPVRRCQHLDCM